MIRCESNMSRYCCFHFTKASHKIGVECRTPLIRNFVMLDRSFVILSCWTGRYYYDKTLITYQSSVPPDNLLSPRLVRYLTIKRVVYGYIKTDYTDISVLQARLCPIETYETLSDYLLFPMAAFTCSVPLSKIVAFLIYEICK